MPIADVHRERLQVTPGRLAVTGMSILSGVALPLATWYITSVRKPGTWTVKGDMVPLWLANIGLFVATIALESRVYDSLERNWKSLINNGYTARRILSHVVTLVVFSGVVPIALVSYEGEKAKPHFDLKLGARFVAAALGADLLWFKNAHQFMHRHLPDMHMLHHCAFVPSFSSNFFFSIPDFIAEFGGPLLGAFAAYKTNVIGQEDHFSFLVFATFVQLFYIMDHDRLLQVEHYRHHTLVNCQYSVYAQSISRRDPLEQLNHTLKRCPTDKIA